MRRAPRQYRAVAHESNQAQAWQRASERFCVLHHKQAAVSWHWPVQGGAWQLTPAVTHMTVFGVRQEQRETIDVSQGSTRVLTSTHATCAARSRASREAYSNPACTYLQGMRPVSPGASAPTAVACSSHFEVCMQPLSNPMAVSCTARAWLPKLAQRLSTTANRHLS